MTGRVCHEDRYCDNVGIFVVENVILTVTTFSSACSLLPPRKSLHNRNINLCYKHSVPYTFCIQLRISLALTFSAVEDCTTTRWHRLGASTMQTMSFSLLPRYHTYNWQDLTISHAFQKFLNSVGFIRSHLSLQMEE